MQLSKFYSTGILSRTRAQRLLLPSTGKERSAILQVEISSPNIVKAYSILMSSSEWAPECVYLYQPLAGHALKSLASTTAVENTTDI